MKKFLLEIIEFFKYKIENDKCTPEDMKAIFNMLNSEVISGATIKDIADFYEQSESNVRNVVSRNSFAKPKRVVMYNFIDFLKVKPEKWKRKTS